MSQEKTEQPTQKKLRDARKKGQVANSKDVTSAMLLIVIFFSIGTFWPSALENLKQLILLPADFYTMPFDQVFHPVLDMVTVKFLQIGLPIMVIGMLTGIAANLIQVGFLFVFEPLKPSLTKLNPVEGAKKIFSIKSLFELGKSILKVGFLGILVYYVIKNSIDPLLKIPFLGIPAILAVFQPILFIFAMNVGFAYAIVAAIDYFFQKKQHIKQLKMTKDEVKREYKEMEGDPEIKGKRKQLQRELANESAVQRTRKATVVVTNPTHYAIAIEYGTEISKLPLVTAKGEGFLAQKMIEVAKEENIPIMRNVPLAHRLFDDAKEGAFVPSDLLVPVAEVLKWVMSLKGEGGFKDTEGGGFGDQS